jgi:hypothetical protein
VIIPYKYYIITPKTKIASQENCDKWLKLDKIAMIIRVLAFIKVSKEKESHKEANFSMSILYN